MVDAPDSVKRLPGAVKMHDETEQWGIIPVGLSLLNLPKLDFVFLPVVIRFRICR